MSRRPLSTLLAAALLLAAPLVAGCSTNPATGQQQLTVIGPEQEAAMGREEHPKILKAFGGVYEEDVELNAYIAGIGARLRAVSELNDKPFTFTVLDSDVVNAFALPGGYVYVTRGLVALANSEAELAGVIAHEIGHVTARHTAQRVTTGLFANLGAAVLGAVLGSPALANVAQVGAAAYVQSYSRDQELEADQLGVRYLARAGYDPRAMAWFLGSLEADSRLEAQLAGQEGREPEASIFSSHPRTPDRIRRAAETAKASLVEAPFVGHVEYLDRVEGMLFGDSPEEGYVRGRVFAHPELGFRFEVPQGFRLRNSTSAVIATRKDGALIQFDGDKVSGTFPMTRYITEKWLAQAPIDHVEPITVNGLKAATATTRGNTNAGPVDVRAVAIRFAPDRVYRFLFATPTKATASLADALRRTTYSFRALSAQEAAELRPKRVRLVRVEPGDTVEAIARLMAYDDFQIDRFVALNRLSPGQKLEPGSLVKIVTEE
jgi:predicted Zn-dependent protease